jgi:IS30 family transposase
MARFFVQLSLDERRIISRMHEKKISQAEIARALRRDRSTICRELRRNFWHDRDVPIAEGYWHVTAHGMAVDRRRKYRKLLRDPGLCAAVIDRLKDGWLPEQISGRLRLASGATARLSHETIYQYVYSREGQDQQLGRHLLSDAAGGDRDTRANPEASSFPWNAPFATDRKRSIREASSVIGRRI